MYVFSSAIYSIYIRCIISSSIVSKFFFDSVHENLSLRPGSYSVISSSLSKFLYNFIIWELHLYLESSLFYSIYTIIYGFGKFGVYVNITSSISVWDGKENQFKIPTFCCSASNLWIFLIFSIISMSYFSWIFCFMEVILSSQSWDHNICYSLFTFFSNFINYDATMSQSKFSVLTHTDNDSFFILRFFCLLYWAEKPFSSLITIQILNLFWLDTLSCSVLKSRLQP